MATASPIFPSQNVLLTAQTEYLTAFENVKKAYPEEYCPDLNTVMAAWGKALENFSEAANSTIVNQSTLFEARLYSTHHTSLAPEKLQDAVLQSLEHLAHFFLLYNNANPEETGVEAFTPSPLTGFGHNNPITYLWFQHLLNIGFSLTNPVKKRPNFEKPPAGKIQPPRNLQKEVIQKMPEIITVIEYIVYKICLLYNNFYSIEIENRIRLNTKKCSDFYLKKMQAYLDFWELLIKEPIVLNDAHLGKQIESAMGLTRDLLEEIKQIPQDVGPLSIFPPPPSTQAALTTQYELLKRMLHFDLEHGIPTRPHFPTAYMLLLTILWNTCPEDQKDLFLDLFKELCQDPDIDQDRLNAQATKIAEQCDSELRFLVGSRMPLAPQFLQFLRNFSPEIMEVFTDEDFDAKMTQQASEFFKGSLSVKPAEGPLRLMLLTYKEILWKTPLKFPPNSFLLRDLHGIPQETLMLKVVPQSNQELPINPVESIFGVLPPSANAQKEHLDPLLGCTKYVFGPYSIQVLGMRGEGNNLAIYFQLPEGNNRKLNKDLTKILDLILDSLSNKEKLQKLVEEIAKHPREQDHIYYIPACETTYTDLNFLPAFADAVGAKISTDINQFQFLETPQSTGMTIVYTTQLRVDQNGATAASITNICTRSLQPVHNFQNSLMVVCDLGRPVYTALFGNSPSKGAGGKVPAAN